MEGPVPPGLQPIACTFNLPIADMCRMTFSWILCDFVSSWLFFCHQDTKARSNTKAAGLNFIMISVRVDRIPDHHRIYDCSSSGYDPSSIIAKLSSVYDGPSSHYDCLSSVYDGSSSHYDRPSSVYDYPSSYYDRPSSGYVCLSSLIAKLSSGIAKLSSGIDCPSSASWTKSLTIVRPQASPVASSVGPRVSGMMFFLFFPDDQGCAGQNNQSAD